MRYVAPSGLALRMNPFYVGFHPTLIYIAPLGLSFDKRFGSTCISLQKLTKTNTIMSGRRPDFDGLKVQEFLTKAQAMAYTMHKSEESFDTYIRPYVHQYRGGNCMLFYVPELRKRMLQMVEIAPSPARNR